MHLLEPGPCHCAGALVVVRGQHSQLGMHPVALAALSGMGLMVGSVLVFLALGMHEMRCQEEAYRRSSYYEGEERGSRSSHSRRSAPATTTAAPQEDECARRQTRRPARLTCTSGPAVSVLLAWSWRDDECGPYHGPFTTQRLELPPAVLVRMLLSGMPPGGRAVYNMSRWCARLLERIFREVAQELQAVRRMAAGDGRRWACGPTPSCLFQHP